MTIGVTFYIFSRKSLAVSFLFCLKCSNFLLMQKQTPVNPLLRYCFSTSYGKGFWSWQNIKMMKWSEENMSTDSNWFVMVDLIDDKVLKKSGSFLGSALIKVTENIRKNNCLLKWVPSWPSINQIHHFFFNRKWHISRGVSIPVLLSGITSRNHTSLLCLTVYRVGKGLVKCVVVCIQKMTTFYQLFALSHNFLYLLSHNYVFVSAVHLATNHMKNDYRSG